MKIFISYSRKDIEFVRKLIGDLEQAKQEVWWDKGRIRGGKHWQSEISDAIASIEYFIVVLTPSSIESDWVAREYTQADKLDKTIIPIQLVQCKLPIALNTLQVIDFQENDYQDNFKELLAAIGYQGDPPVVTPFKPQPPLPAPHRRFILPGIVIMLIVLIAIMGIVFAVIRNPHPNQPPIPTATYTPPAALVPTGIPGSIPDRIIIKYGDGIQKSYDCPKAKVSAVLSGQEKVSLELLSGKPEKTMEKLEWVSFVSGTEELFGTGKTAIYFPTGEGIIYIILDQAIICALNVQ